MHLFFAEEIRDHSGKLNKEESHHAHRVLRMTKGDPLYVTEGQGVIYKAEVVSLSKTELVFTILSEYSRETSQNYLHIAIAPTKSLDRFEFFLEKATEIGVDEITPVIGFHSERKVYKTERGKKVIKAAAKQSFSHWLPVLNEAVSVKDFLTKPHSSSLFIAHCDDTGERKEIAAELSRRSKSIVLVGPEGDFSKEEIRMAKEHFFEAVSLGTKRLRTETAGITVAIAGKILR